MPYLFKKMEISEETLKDVQKLLHLSFPKRTQKFSLDYLRWQYKDNPNGEAISFNAYAEDGTMAAHYATIPIVMRIGNSSYKGLLSLNTATHPNHRGKKLFTQLADITYSYAQSHSYSFVIGVANANSTDGFLKHLGFYLITPLSVKIGVGNILKNTKIENFNHVVYNDKTILWRLKCPGRIYSILNENIYGQIDVPLFQTCIAKLPVEKSLVNKDLPKAFVLFNLYIGIGANNSGLYVNLPRFIKRSPFNLIFKDLTGGKLPVLTRENTLFQLLDFDVA